MKEAEKILAKGIENISEIANNIILWYNNTCYLNKPTKTINLLKMAKSIIKLGKLSDSDSKFILSKVKEHAKNINSNFDLSTKHAPVLNPVKLFDLAITIWTNDSAEYADSFIIKKMASLQLILASATGARWADIVRLRWDFLTARELDHGLVIRFKLPFTKSDPYNQNSKSISIFKNEKVKYCPIFWLKQFWALKGKPSQGFIFSLEENEPVKIEKTFYYVKKFAKQENFPVLPTRHTPRVSMTAFLAVKKVPKERILEALNWSHNSLMLERYLNWHLSELTDSPAFIWSQEFHSAKPFAYLNNMPI